MMPDVLIDQGRFPAPARIAIVVCTPFCVLADIVAIFVGFGHHEQLGVGVGHFSNLDIVAVYGGVHLEEGALRVWVSFRGVGLVLKRWFDSVVCTCHGLGDWCLMTRMCLEEPG